MAVNYGKTGLADFYYGVTDSSVGNCRAKPSPPQKNDLTDHGRGSRKQHEEINNRLRADHRGCASSGC